MSTDLSRLNIYMREADKKALQQVADDFGCSLSRLCGDVLINSLPQLKVTAEAMKLARTDPKKAADLMAKASESAQGDLLQAMEGLNNETD